jgi:hypothetical protein
VKDEVRQIEIHITEPLVPGPSSHEAEIAIPTLKKYKWPGSDHILAELIQAGGRTLVSVIHKLINSIWNKDKLPDQWRVIKVTVIIIVGYHSYQLHTKLY